MKEYKRLTKYSEENQDYITPYCDTANCDGLCLTCDYEQVIINRLADLENKIENGTLIELPCKVGDTVYCIAHCSQGKFINSITIRTIYDIFDLWDYFCNKTIFLTKAEAKKKLEELKNENTCKQ